jgi:hypothetical protein
MNEKTLTILLGNARGGEATWETMYNNLLNVYNSDLALLFGEKESKTESLYAKAKYIWEIKEYSDWYDYYNEFCTGEWFAFYEKNKSHGTGGGVRDFIGSGAIIFAFRHYLKNNFKHIASLYDRIIITRSDYYYIDKHPLLPNDKVYIVEGEDYGGITDRHHIFPSNKWDEILGIVEFLSNNSNLTGNPETILKYMFDHHKIDYDRFKRVQFTVALPSDSTRWCKANGVLPENNNLLIKYKTEYETAIKNKSA